MRFILLLLFILSVNVFAQKPDSQYSKSRIYINSNIDIKNLMDHGVAADHGIIKQNTFIESVFSSQEIEKAKSLGYQVVTLVEDMQEYYIKNVRDRETRKSKNPEPCESSGVTEYETPANFNLGSMGGFLTYTQILAELDDMQALYPDLITIKSPISSFETIENRPIYWIKISDNPTTNESEPEILYTAIHHAREPASVQQLIFYMWYLLENYSSDSDIQTLVDNTEMYFVPVINVDGYIYNETTNPNGGGYWRKNRRNNGDGTYGVDLNRNYSYEWGGSGTSGSGGETYPGTSGFSEPETQAIKWFCEQHSFIMALNNHTYSELLLYPFGYAANTPTPDDEAFQAISSLMVSQNGYTNQISADLYPASGVSDDWMYGDTSTHDKIFAMTPEIGYAFWPSQSDIIPICKEMMFLNITGAKLIHNYAEIEDNSPPFVSSINGVFDYSIHRIGLGEPGDFTVSIIPVSSNLINIGNSNSHTGLEMSETELGSIAYSLNNSIQIGDLISYKLIVDNGLFSSEKTINKTFGNLTEIFLDNCDTTTAYWNNSDWGTSTTAYVSTPASITDSPSGNYNDNVNSNIVLSDPIDLTDALMASVSFYSKWEIENNWDYVQFEVSIDNGTTWQAQCGKFTNTGVSNQNSAEGEPLYDGIQTDWILEEIDLNDYVGEQILFRFTLVSDTAVTEDGFYFDDLSVKIIEASSSGIPANELANFSIYPNPASNYLKINVPVEGKEYQLDIISTTGQVISQHTVSNSKPLIDLTNISKGIYFIKVFSEGTSKVCKFIKN